MILFRLSGGSQGIQFIMHFAYNHYLAKVDAKRWNRHKKNLLQKQLDVLLNICSKSFVKLTGKQLCWSHFLIKGDSSTGAFLWILTTFLKQPFNASYTQKSHTAVMAFILFVSLECWTYLQIKTYHVGRAYFVFLILGFWFCNRSW